MSLRLLRAAFFIEDFDRQVSWYVEQAGDTAARRFMAAVWKSLGAIVAQPGMGKTRRDLAQRLRERPGM